MLLLLVGTILLNEVSVLWTQRSIMNPSINRFHNNSHKGLYHKLTFNKIFIYDHQILTESFVCVACVDQDNNPFGNNSIVRNVKWYHKGRPIHKSDYLRTFVDRFGFIAILSTKSSAFDIICVAENIKPYSASKNVSVMHRFEVKDFSVHIESLGFDLSLTFQAKKVNLSTNSTDSEKYKKEEFKRYLENTVKPCSEMFNSRIKKLAKPIYESICYRAEKICQQEMINFYDCSLDEYSLQINISMDISYYYSYRRINLFSPISDYDTRKDNHDLIDSLFPIETEKLFTDIILDEFSSFEEYLNVTRKINHGTEMFCIGSASLLDKDNDQNCILCTAGSYISAFYGPVLASYKKGGLCELCPKDHYADLDGSYECKPCPPRTITFFDGAYNESQCQSEDEIFVEGLMKRYFSRNGQFRFLFELGETDKIMLLGFMYFSPVIVIIALWIVHNSLVTGTNFLKNLYDLQLELGQLVILVKAEEADRRIQGTIKRQFTNEAYMNDSYVE